MLCRSESGETIRENAWGQDRKYLVAFLSGGSPQHPLVEFVAADDFKDTRELVAVIRGSDGGRREQRMAEAALVDCPTTGQTVVRVLQPFAPRYTGTGFYSTDQ